jgi:cytochrome c-type biogenesis protein CcsB
MKQRVLRVLTFLFAIVKRRLPVILTALAAIWVATSLVPRSDRSNGFDITAFGKLPLVFDGRLQPFDSLARNSLVQMRERQSLYDIREKRDVSATEWLLEVMMKPEAANQRRTFRIMHPELQSLLKLPVEPNAQTGDDGKLYSWSQIEPSVNAIRDQVAQVPKEGSKRTPFQQALMKLHNAATLYIRLQNTLHPMDAAGDFQKELKDYRASIPEGVTAFRQRFTGQAFDTNALGSLIERAERYVAEGEMEAPLVVPPWQGPGEHSKEWVPMAEALLEPSLPYRRFTNFVSAITQKEGDNATAIQNLLDHAGQGAMRPSVDTFAQMTDAFRAGNAAEFNRLVGAHAASLAGPYDKALGKARNEALFNGVAPFYKALVLYIAVFLLGATFWFTLAEWARTSAVWLTLLAWIVHSGGLIARMILEGRPPVTNLYSSAIFIGWGAVVLGLILERFWRNAVGIVVSSTLGFVTLVIAHNLSLGGDTMEMMRAVLDTNFWLATHVVVVTLGYASTFVGGFLAILYVVLGVFTPRLSESVTSGARARTEPMGKALTRMIYGIVCFATLFSFVGTVLGGIWADQSWGRFWGWDPKENGALIIVLWNALILHARWGGLVKERGIANLAIVGNIVTSWSWFGTNMLGIGLHSYGWTDSAFRWLMLFIASQLLLIGLGLIPRERWRSFRGSAKEPSVATPGRKGPKGGKLATA